MTDPALPPPTPPLDNRPGPLKLLVLPLLLTALPWLVQLGTLLTDEPRHRLALIPRTADGVIGILTMPLLHSGWDHLMANTLPLVLLLFGLFLFYGRKGWGILCTLYLVSGLATWLMGRPGTAHIGASGVVYALAAFHFTSGLIRRVPEQRAFALLVAFLYGGFVWAFFPTLYRHTDISWEGHLSGLLAGIAFAFYYRTSGPPPPPDPFADEPLDPDCPPDTLEQSPDSADTLSE